MPLPHDYTERVYAGVLGKIIGVYLGRPFEGWTYERISAELGEIWYYVHERFGVPLIVTDDDISGTFTFLRALPDYGNARHLTPAQIGQSWLNYIIEKRTILWWGGMGHSTEHTAYLRLKQGIAAPESGSIARNGKTVAEQIGAQIFIDGWAMVAPGDPELAAELARRAASVSHDGEAVYGAQMVAAMEAQAFVEPNIDKLLDTGLALIPADSVIARMIHEIRDWHAASPHDWRKTRAQIAGKYGYDKFPGNCHMVPNHALIIHALLHGDDDFQKSLMIVNTCGWDTDCNSGNVGCLLGIKNGLAGIERGPDFRGPVADRMYLPTADGGRAVTDAVAESYHIVNVGRALHGESPVAPKDGALFHFELPGAVQGFLVEENPTSAGTARIENVVGHSERGARSLAIHYQSVAPGRTARVGTPTFIPSKAVAEYFERRGYGLLASPRLYPGQTVTARLVAAEDNAQPVNVGLYARVFGGEDDETRLLAGPQTTLAAGAAHLFTWTIPDTGGCPIAQIGVEIAHERHAAGTLYLDFVTWAGTPSVHLTRAVDGGSMWRRAWVNGMDIFESRAGEPFRLIQNEGRGLLIQGTRAWTDYRAEATLTLHLAKAAGLAVRVQGMRRYYALLLCDNGTARLVKVLDGEQILAQAPLAWTPDAVHTFSLEAKGQQIRAAIDGVPLFDLHDTERPLDGGGVAFVVEAGRIASEGVKVNE